MQKEPKVALITGGARRIGAEIAKLLHAAGMNIIIHYNLSTDAADELSRELNSLRPHSVVSFRANLAEIDTLEDGMTRAVAAFGRLDVLINNASRFYKTPMGEVTSFQWDDLLDSNLKAPFFLAQSAAPHLRKTQGCIINLADVHAERPMRDYAVYCISKAGLVMLTKSLAKELAPDIRVNAVAPGTVMLPEGDNTLTPELQDKILARIALQHYGDPQDIAKSVLFLIKDAPYMTGQILTVDGGRSLFI